MILVKAQHTADENMIKDVFRDAFIPGGLQPHLGADSCGGLTQGQNGNVLGSVQPVDGQFGAGSPLHHGHVVLAGDAQRPDQATMTNTGF